MRRAFILAIIFAALDLLGGCATVRPIYEWGGYEDSLADLFKGGEAQNRAGERLGELEKLVARSRALGKRTPPGLLAHVGYLYAASGNLGQARRYFRAEKEEWPVSSAFMDRLAKEVER